MATLLGIVAAFAVIVAFLLGLHFNQPIPDALPDDAYQSLRNGGSFVQVLWLIDKLGVHLDAWNQMDLFKNVLDYLARKSFTKDIAVKFQDTRIAGVPVRVFWPAQSTKDKLPAVLYYHGGGWIFGSAVSYSEACQRITKQAHVVVVSVEYRLAPAHTFPRAFDDCYAVAKALLKKENKHGIDQSRIVLMGDSAGGNLAAAVTLQLRHTKETPLAQILVYPALQFMDFNLPSYKMQGTWLLDQNRMGNFWSLYLTGSEHMTNAFLSGNHSAHLQHTKYATYISDTKVDHSKVKSPHKGIPPKVLEALTDPRASPLMADKLIGLPPTFIITCEFDVLKSEGILYKERLQAAGNEVTFKNYMSYHAVFGISDILSPPIEKQYMYRDILQFLRNITDQSV